MTRALLRSPGFSVVAVLSLAAPCLFAQPKPIEAKEMQESTAAITRKEQVTICAPRSPIFLPKKPAMIAPSRGRNTIRASMLRLSPLALHHIDVFDRDGAAVAEVDHQDR